jgi:hypothetical protein
MTATISAGNGAGSTTPTTVLSPWATSWQSRNIIHDLIGGGIAVSLVAPRPRSGTMELLYQTEALAFAAATLHQEETTFTLIDDQTTNVSMTYVVAGEVSVRLDEETLKAWVVTVGYQGVTP